MTLWILFWFALSVVCDVSGQLCFKIGAERLPDLHEASPGQFAAGVLTDYWLLIGIAIYIVETFVWLRILAEVPLSVAFPIASLNLLGVVLASRVFLNETVGPRRILGASLITLGVIIVARTA